LVNLGIFQLLTVLSFYARRLERKKVYQGDSCQEANNSIYRIEADVEVDLKKLWIIEHLKNTSNYQVKMVETQYERKGKDPKNRYLLFVWKVFFV